MKVCSLPAEVPVPNFDYMNYVADTINKQEQDHRDALKAHLLGMGFKGKHTGRILRIPHADGYAEYMFADAPRGACLINLPYCDAWDSPMARGLTKGHIIKMMDAEDRMQALFAKK